MANVKRNQLSTLGVQHAGPGVHIDGGGLELRVRTTGAKSWVMRLTRDGKRRNIGLGPYPSIGLAEARRRAERVRRGEPLEERAEGQAVEQLPVTPTLAAVTAEVHKLRAPGWTERHAEGWLRSLTLHVLTTLGDRPVNTITTADALALLTPLWTSTPTTARFVKQRLSLVFDFALAAGHIDSNPLNGALKAALPRKRPAVRHHAALPYGEIPELIASIRARGCLEITKLALELLILTACRSGEVRNAEWREIDLDAKLWTIPAARMKMRRVHRVPLSTGALAVLERARSIAGEGSLVFPSDRRRGGTYGGLSIHAFAYLLRQSGYGHITPHGFRASFRTWAMEATATPWAICETALAHRLGGGEVVAYARGDLLEQRRALMTAWSHHCLRRLAA